MHLPRVRFTVRRMIIVVVVVVAILSIPADALIKRFPSEVSDVITILWILFLFFGLPSLTRMSVRDVKSGPGNSTKKNVTRATDDEI